jgi:GNAT superfamily N-acetyltransferase
MDVEYLTYKDKNQAVDVLASAFAEYPVMRYVLRDGALYDLHLKELVGFFCETRLTRRWPLWGVRSEGELVAVAGINEPIHVTWPPQLHQVYENLKATIGTAAVERLESYENESSGHEPEAPHYFLGIIGVSPAYQGKGYARILIDRLQRLSESDPISTGVCLSTENARNLPIYKHLGFEVIAEAQVGELHTWCMFRHNRTGENVA